MSRTFGYLRQHPWPVGLAATVLGLVAIDAVLVTASLRDGGAVAEEGYYEKALRYDETRARQIRAAAAGLNAEIVVADSPAPVVLRRIDVKVWDGAGLPVNGLRGTLTAVRPSDIRLTRSGPIVAVPDESGTYRSLLPISVAGLWEFQLELIQGQEDYGLTVRQDVQL